MRLNPGLNCRIPCHLFACHWIRIASIVLCFVLQRTPTNENNGGTEWRGIQQLLLDYLKDESVSRSHNYCQIQIGIPACVMSSEYFVRTSLYLVRLKISQWVKLLRRHSNQIRGNWAVKNFITASRVNSRFITHARMQRWIWNLQLPTGSTSEYSWTSVSDHPKCKNLVIAYGRWSLTRIEPQGASSEKRSGHVYFMGYNLLHAMSNLCHV